jgi:hypothetical protein
MKPDQNHLRKTNIIPQLILRKQKLHIITNIPEYYRIHEYEIATVKNLIKEVFILNTFHPNACDGVWTGVINHSVTPPLRAKFCLPYFIQDKELSKESEFAIKRYLSIINYEESYYIDPKIDYIEAYPC